MKDKIEDILENNLVNLYTDGYETKLTTKELYNLFIDEQIKLLNKLSLNFQKQTNLSIFNTEIEKLKKLKQQ